jgi:hypothetical protein
MTPRRPLRSRQDMAAYRPCLACGQPTLMAELTTGQTVHLDVRQPCFVVTWAEQAALPQACESRAYALHACQGACTSRRKRV